MSSAVVTGLGNAGEVIYHLCFASRNHGGSSSWQHHHMPGTGFV
jgi:hypothetical protein